MGDHDLRDDFYETCVCQTAQKFLDKRSEVEASFSDIWNQQLDKLPSNWTAEDIYNEKCEVWQFLCACLYEECPLTGERLQTQTQETAQKFGWVEYTILAVCAAIFVIGIIGNGLTLLVLLKTGKWRKNTTNLLIWSLSIADFSVVLFMAIFKCNVQIISFLHLSQPLCVELFDADNEQREILRDRLYYAISSVQVTHSRSQSNRGGVDGRHYHICSSFMAMALSNYGEQNALSCIFIYSLGSEEFGNLSICSLGDLSQASHVQVYRILLIVVTFILPAGTVTGQAFAISSYLRRQPLGYTEKTQRLRVKVMLMTVACCALFIVFWAPYHANQMRIVLDYYSNNGGTINGNDFVYEVVSKLFSLGNSIINPFIYFSVSESFQLELRKLCGGEPEISAESTNQQSLSNESSGFNRSVHIDNNAGFTRSSSWNRSERLHSARSKLRTERNCASP
ncbi:Oidioi.mRNA.OKI2018_I69.XSR.g15306.t1.cds [Oikopleura dioica]|uniref:Oidioi.mRNA.OKI2018_I69.XSR.g15306.t1.cds n=1 Tax=Oikopleura dioica TaxID=34765 RepID=A0ABN7SGK1_OIKDI|nr:Oidioi.mRNA.OKI2018_I69.XSR.g15306.t1.cds [Oikopleura dioica]